MTLTTIVFEMVRRTSVLKNALSVAMVFVTLFATFVATASGDIGGFNETFDGDGDFTGIAGFNVVGQGVDLLEWDSGNLSIVNEPGYDETSQVYISRFLNGSGSFTQTVRVHNLDLGDLDFGSPTPAVGYVQLLFTIGEPTEDPNRMMLFLIEPESLDDSGLVDVASITSGQRNFGPTVELGSSIEFGMSFDSDARQVRYWYDADYNDPMSELLELGPYEYTGALHAEHMTGLSFFAHWDGHASGLLDNWVLQPSNSAVGDFDFDGTLGLGDVDLLQRHIRNGTFDALIDIIQDGALDQEDVAFWVHDIKGSFFGDVDLDGEFSSADLINVFQAGEYEDDVVGNSTWSTGDWNTDGEFSTSDLVVAFQDGGYEGRPRAAVASVPEPRGLLSLLIGTLAFARRALGREGCGVFATSHVQVAQRLESRHSAAL